MMTFRPRGGLAAASVVRLLAAALLAATALPAVAGADVVPDGAAAAGAWSLRVQVIHDAVSGEVVRARLRAWDPQPGLNLEFVFEPDPASGFDPAATGGVVAGRGKLVWRVRGSASYDRRTVHSTYVGELADGRPHGRGRLERRDGEVFEGDWAHGVFEGRGMHLDAAGNRYSGPFAAGLPHGEGRQAMADGSIYEGGFRNGLRHGEATMRLPGGTTYASLWRDGIEIGGSRPEVLADAMIGGLLRAQGGGGDAGKVNLSVTVDQRITRLADINYVHHLTAGGLEIYPDNPGMIETWNGTAPITPESNLQVFRTLNPDDAPAFLQVGLETTGDARVRLDSLQLAVEDSQVYRKPFLSVNEHWGCVGFRPSFTFQNNGWGPARDGRLTVEFFNIDAPEKASRSFSLPVPGFDEGTHVSVRDLLDEAGVDTVALERARFTCASQDDMPQCRQRALQGLDFGEVADLVAGSDRFWLGMRGRFAYSYADDRGGVHEVSEPVEASLQLGVIESEYSVAEGSGGWGEPPSALRYQEVHLPADARDYTVDIALRGNRNVSSHVSRLKIHAEHNSIHRFRAVARFADGSLRQSMPVSLYYLMPRSNYFAPPGWDDPSCYLPPEYSATPGD